MGGNAVLRELFRRCNALERTVADDDTRKELIATLDAVSSAYDAKPFHQDR